MNPAVIGAGSWGTALANLLGEKGIKVNLWALEEEICDNINKEHRNPIYLNNYKISDNVTATNSIKDACLNSDCIVMVTPSHVYRQVITEVNKHIKPDVPVVSATKGIENDTYKFMSSITAEIRGTKEGKNFAVLTGPTFAEEIIQHQPSAAVLATTDEALSKSLIEIFNIGYFRLYYNIDIIGAQLGAALKNIIAIASGISEGLGLGLNSQAALITRGSAEMIRLGKKIGAKSKTLAGLAGMGDLILTATGGLSRNRTLGVRLGKGEKLTDILSGSFTVAEGVKTTKSAYELSRRLDVEMPIVNSVYDVLYREKNAKLALKDLMERKLKAEYWHDW